MSRIKRLSRFIDFSQLGNWRKSKSLQEYGLCASCRAIILTDSHFADIPETPTATEGISALDLKQGVIDVDFLVKDSYPSFPHLRESSDNCCKLCNALLTIIVEDISHRRDLWDKTFKDGDTTYLSLHYHCTAESGNQSFNFGEWPTMLSTLEVRVKKGMFNSDGYISLHLRIFADDGSPVGQHLRIRRRRIENSTINQNNVNLMNHWINTCYTQHEKCSGISKTWGHVLPKRLVYVPQDTTLEPLRVVDVDLISKEDLQYAALSYCWGPSSSLHFTTTTSTLQERQSGFEPSQIPQTFKDAFLVTQLLDLSYIWIDALCIVQDDKKEWAQEAAKMGDIYRHAHVTIAAVAARSTEDGFLNRYNRRDIDIPFTSASRPLINGKYYLLVDHLQPGGAEEEDFYADVENSTWNNRGWTFQERILSHRILFFGERMMHFICRSERRSENYIGNLKRGSMWNAFGDGASTDMLSTTWRTLMHTYSARLLSFDSDKIPALTSLAKEFLEAFQKNNTNTEFIVGFWKHTILEDLGWSKTSFPITNPSSPINHTQLNPLKPNLAPSWSWCSTNCEVQWMRLPREITYVALVEKIKLDRSDWVFGGPLNGYIQVNGRLTYPMKLDLKPGSRQIRTIPRTSYTTGIGPWTETIEYDADLPSEFQNLEIHLALLFGSSYFVCGLVLAELDIDEAAVFGTDTHEIQFEGDPGHGEFYNLKSVRKFRRVGNFNVQHNGYGSSPWQWYLNNFFWARYRIY